MVATEHLSRIQRRHPEGPADLVIEVISPTSRVRDTVHKLAEYDAAGVPEYWIIDPVSSTTTFYREDAGRFADVTPTSGVYRSWVLPDVRIDPGWLWQRPLPDPLDILADWGVI